MNSLLQSSSGSSSARDRTNEFMTTIRSLQGQQLGRNGSYNQQVAPQNKHGQLGKYSNLKLHIGVYEKIYQILQNNDYLNIFVKIKLQFNVISCL